MQDAESELRSSFGDDEISFLFSCNYCVCFVDIIGSTRITAGIDDPNRIRQYYSMFFSKIGQIARRFDARIIKIAGDCLICYFPKTADPANNSAFKDVLECGCAMIAAHDGINFELNVMNLPSLEYRISADYGRVEIAKSATSRTEDLFGSTMNLCAKINRMAAQNGMVIGGDLYQIVKAFSFNDFSFEDIGGYDIGLKHFYPVYSVIAKKRDNISGSGRDSIIPPSPRQTMHGSEILRRLHFAKNNNNNNSPSKPIIAAAGHTSNSTNVMVVDDEQDMLLTFKEFLRLEGHRAEVFVNPQEALKRYREVNPSYYGLIILDIRMPGMNGLQLYQRLKAINSNINVLFISALDAADELCSIFSGILPHNVIRKPVLREQFIHRVELCLAGHEQH
ncbi:response regulator [Candidatus Nitrososphaera evergladensis]|nr:response regulator [Candidatus Nitrososphaera evergladensis]